MTQMISITVQRGIKTISVTKWFQTRLCQHNRGPTGQTHLDGIGGSTHKIRGYQTDSSRLVLAGVLSLITLSILSPFGFLLLCRCRREDVRFTDEVSKYRGASSSRKGKKSSLSALSSERHQKRSPLSVAQEKAKSHVTGHKRRDRTTRPIPTGFKMMMKASNIFIASC